jgi:hypothetical protein
VFIMASGPIQVNNIPRLSSNSPGRSDISVGRAVQNVDLYRRAPENRQFEP